jgi:hypothetical protein
MVNAEQAFLRWAFKPKAQRTSIRKRVVREYGDIIYKIAGDIFNSCIADYYASYTPTVYTRHGDKKGFNLYRLNDISPSENGFRLRFDEDFLLKYGTKEDIRESVMEAVLSGLRGHEGMNRKPIPTDDHPEPDVWPMAWYTSYPNKFSEYRYWKSKYNTMDEIFYDFVQNVIDDTEDLFWDTLNKYV